MLKALLKHFLIKAHWNVWHIRFLVNKLQTAVITIATAKRKFATYKNKKERYRHADDFKMVR